MKTKKLIATILVIVICFISIVPDILAKNLYVDGGTGNDGVTYANNNESNPWRTLGRAVWGQSTRPASYPGSNSSQAAQAGDVVIVGAGTYLTNQAVSDRGVPIYNPVNSGSAGSVITFQAEGTVVLQSNTSGVGEPIIGAQGKNYIVWDGFYLDEANIHTKSDTGPVTIFGSQFVTIKNCTIIGKYNAWDDNHVGIRLENSSDIQVINNTISKFRYYASGSDSQNATGIEAYNTDRVVIMNNTIFDCGSGMYIKQDNQGPYYIHHNFIYGCGGHGILLQQLTSGKVYQNIIIDTPNGFKIQSYNVAYGPNAEIFNNVVHNANGDQGAFYISSVQYTAPEGIKVYNNIFSGSVRAISAGGSPLATFQDKLEFEHNHYYNNNTTANIGGTNYTLSALKSSVRIETVSGNGRAGEESNPGYADAANDNFELLAGANARDGGQDYFDLDSDRVTQESIDRGAYITGYEQIGASSSPIVLPTVPTIPSGWQFVQ